MEPSQLLFNIIDTSTDAFMLLEKQESEVLNTLYTNTAMEQLLETTSGALPDDVISLVLKHLTTDAGVHTLHSCEYFDGVFDLHLRWQDSQVLLNVTPCHGGLFEHITLSDLGSSCSALVLVLNEEGNMVDVNDCFSKFVGHDKSELLGESFLSTFIPGDAQKLGAYFQEILSRPSYHQNFVTPIKNFEGKIHRMNWQVSRLVRNEHTYVIAIGSDISRLIERQDDLQRELSSVKVGFNHFPYAVAYVSDDGVLTSMNIRFRELFHLKEPHPHFDSIALFKEKIGFQTMCEHIALIKELGYTLSLDGTKFKIDIRLLESKHKTASLYMIIMRPL